jgi:raffinose/stachyose/melibiose transport system permease protein
MKKKTWWKTLLVVFISALHIIPLYITFIASVKEMGDFTSYWIPPKTFFFHNYVLALNEGGMLEALKNTILITAFSVVLIVVI